MRITASHESYKRVKVDTDSSPIRITGPGADTLGRLIDWYQEEGSACIAPHPTAYPTPDPLNHPDQLVAVMEASGYQLTPEALALIDRTAEDDDEAGDFQVIE